MELDSSNRISAGNLEELLTFLLEERQSAPDDRLPAVMIWGPPGAGKSAIVRSVARKCGCEFIDLRLAQMEAIDIKGLPVPEPDGVHWKISAVYPRVVSLPDLPGGPEREEEKNEEKDEEQPSLSPPDPEGKDEETCVQQGNSSSGAEKGQKRNDPSSPGGTGDSSSDEEHQEADCSCDPSMREVWRQRIIEAGQNYKLVYGELPAELAGLVEFFSEGRINYMQLLRRYLGRCSGGEAAWLPPARRFVWQKQYLPSRRNPKLEIVVAVDTSGSINKEDFQQFFGEIFTIVQSFPNYQLTVIQCDAAIQSVHRFSRESPFKKETPFEIKGGGGTGFTPVFDCLAKEKITPRVLLY